MPKPKTSTRVLAASLLFIAIFVLVGAGIGGMMYLARVEAPRSDASPLAPMVEVMTVSARDVVERFIGYGSVVAARNANVAAEISATVIERVDDIRAGRAVQKGQPLVRLDDREYRHALDRANALIAGQHAALEELEGDARSLDALIRAADQELRVARDERTRVADLFERELAAKKEFDFATLAYQQASRVRLSYQRERDALGPRQASIAASIRSFEAESALARLNIERCVVSAPFAGHVEAVHVDAGDRVAPGIVVVSIVDRSRVELPIQLASSVYTSVQVGARCSVTVESLPDVSWEGSIDRIAPVADRDTRMFAVYAFVDNTRYARPLVPGMFVRATIQGPTHVGGLLIPRSAFRGGKVLIVRDDVICARTVTLGRVIEDEVLVESGVDAGDRVVVSRPGGLAEGSPVRVKLRPTDGNDSPTSGARVHGVAP